MALDLEPDILPTRARELEDQESMPYGTGECPVLLDGPYLSIS